ncbi:MAG: TIGR01777 family oxidoreductase [Dehalococcoidia bacterium]
MRVLVTGATGFIGSRLAEVLSEKGHIVLGLSRNPEAAMRSTTAVRRFFAWDGKSAPPAEALSQADAVVNLAGETVNGRWNASKKQRILDSRIDGTRAIVKAMAAAEAPKVLINGGAVGFYGDRGDEVLTEDSQRGGGFLADVVEAWEREAFAAKSSGVRVASLRTGIVLGPNGGALKPLKLLANLGANGPVGSGKQWWPWIHRDDVCLAIEYLLSNPAEGVFNLTAPNPARQKDFAKALGKVMSRPSFMPAPAFAVRLVQGGFADEVLFSKRVLPKRLTDAGFSFTYPELEPALRQVLGE